MKVQFDIKYRPQIESGKYKVILDCGVEAEILAWDKPGKYPIVCMAKKEDAIPFKTDNSGIAYHYPEGSNYSDLFIITPEPELSEFEQSIVNTIEDELHHTSDDGSVSFGVSIDNETANVLAKKLLDLARKELVKQGYVIEKKAFHDAVEKIDDKNKAEMSIQYSLHCKIENGTRHAVMNWESFQKLAQKFIDIGKAETLKDLPRWKKDDSIEAKQYITVGKNGERFHYNGHSLLIYDLTKLPGFKED